MVSSDERMDALVDGVNRLSLVVESLKVRMDSVESVLATRTTAIQRVYDYMQDTNERLAKIEACTAAQDRVWSKYAPFITAIFTMLVGAGGAVLLHVYGGK
jgi:chromosome segregation ATPase